MAVNRKLLVENSTMVQENILGRWSPRAFSEEKISREELNTLITAASWAASANNGQPWRFVYAFKGTPEFEKLLGTLAEGNQIWAKNAAVLMGVFGRTRHEYKERENPTWMYEIGLAMGNLSIQAHYMGIYLHQMGGFSKEAMAKESNMPEAFEPVVAVAIGRMGDASLLEEPLKSRETAPRTRKELEEISFIGRF